MYNFVDVELPSKLSDLINLALDDLIKCEEQCDKYKVDMGAYCSNTIGYFENTDKCFVCFAGAVMAQTLKCPGDYETESYLINNSVYADAINALDSVRLGRVNSALRNLNVENNKDYSKFVVRYANDPLKFKKQMREISATLAADGL